MSTVPYDRVLGTNKKKHTKKTALLFCSKKGLCVYSTANKSDFPETMVDMPEKSLEDMEAGKSPNAIASEFKLDPANEDNDDVQEEHAPRMDDDDEVDRREVSIVIGGRNYSKREYGFVLMVGIILAFNSGYINGSCLSGLLTSVGLRQSVAGFTGAYTLAGLELASGELAMFGAHIKMILSFIFGSFIAGVLTPKAEAYRILPSYGPTFLIGAAFLTGASLLSAFHVETYYFFYLAAAANGIQNGMSSIYSANLIRSTHLTGTSTDIGLYIGQCVRGNKANLWKLQVLIILACSFWFGGVISYFATSRFTSWSLLFNAGLFLFIGMCFVSFLVHELGITVWAALFGTWQWKRAIPKLQSLSSTRDIMAVFDVVDQDDDGCVDGDELFQALKKAGVRISKREARAMFRAADRDKDGTISRMEWCQMVHECSNK